MRAKQPCETLWTTSSTCPGKEPWDRTSAGEHLAHAETVCSLPTREGDQENCIQGPSKQVQQNQVALTDIYMETSDALRKEALQTGQ